MMGRFFCLLPLTEVPPGFTIRTVYDTLRRCIPVKKLNWFQRHPYLTVSGMWLTAAGMFVLLSLAELPWAVTFILGFGVFFLLCVTVPLSIILFTSAWAKLSLRKDQQRRERTAAARKAASEPKAAPVPPVQPAPPAKASPQGVTWTLDEQGTLTLRGTGPAIASRIPDRALWLEKKDRIRRAVVEEGVTVIGASLFEDHAQLRSVTLPRSLTGLYARAFANCGKLESINLPQGLNLIADAVFLNCASLKNLTIPPKAHPYPPSALEGCGYQPPKKTSAPSPKPDKPAASAPVPQPGDPRVRMLVSHLAAMPFGTPEEVRGCARWITAALPALHGSLFEEDIPADSYDPWVYLVLSQLKAFDAALRSAAVREEALRQAQALPTRELTELLSAMALFAECRPVFLRSEFSMLFDELCTHAASRSDLPADPPPARHKDYIGGKYRHNPVEDVSERRMLLWELFETRRDQGQLTCSYVAIHLRRGTLHRVDSRAVQYGVTMSSQEDVSGLSWQDFRALCKEHHITRYKGMNADNWRAYVPADALKRAEPKPPEPPMEVNPQELRCDLPEDFDAWYVKLNPRFATNVVYLRRVESGWRMYYTTTSDPASPMLFMSPDSCTEPRLAFEVRVASANRKSWDRLLTPEEFAYARRVLPAAHPAQRPGGKDKDRVPISIYSATLTACYRKDGQWVPAADMKEAAALQDLAHKLVTRGAVCPDRP